MDTHYHRKKLYMMAMVFLVIGGLNWGVVALTGGDLVSSLFGKGSVIARGIFLIVALAAAYFAFQRDFYLPFLGETHIPCAILQDMTPEGADTSIGVKVRPGAKVVYFAAEPENEDMKSANDYKAAYLMYRNAGVATADEDGNVILKVRTPQGFTMPMKGQLPPHIHYRVCSDIQGFMGPIVTVTLDGNEYFENYVSQEETNEVVNEQGDFAYVRPGNALAEINADAQETAQNSLMPESGGFVEGPRKSGADLEAAFASPLDRNTPMLTSSVPDGDRTPM